MTVIVPLDAPHRLWVFALDMTADQATALSDAAIAALLGVTALDHDFVEIFDTADLTGLGLTGYLTTGNAITEAQLAPDRARLDALRGPVLILFAAAFTDRPVTLHPDPRLTLIGSYAEDAEPVQFEPLPDADAACRLGAPGKSDAQAPPSPIQSATMTPDQPPVPPPSAPKYSNARQSGMVATYALLVMFALVALMVWLA